MNLLLVEEIYDEIYDEIFDVLKPKNVTTTDEGDLFLFSTRKGFDFHKICIFNSVHLKKNNFKFHLS